VQFFFILRTHYDSEDNDGHFRVSLHKTFPLDNLKKSLSSYHYVSPRVLFLPPILNSYQIENCDFIYDIPESIPYRFIKSKIPSGCNYAEIDVFSKCFTVQLPQIMTFHYPEYPAPLHCRILRALVILVGFAISLFCLHILVSVAARSL